MLASHSGAAVLQPPTPPRTYVTFSATLLHMYLHSYWELLLSIISVLSAAGSGRAQQQQHSCPSLMQL
jgi:hypothetical protein